MFSSDKWFGAEAGFYNSVATQSLRFNDDDSAYLSRTPSSEGNRRTFTLSAWVKRSNTNTDHQFIFSAKENTNYDDGLYFSSSNTLVFKTEINDADYVLETTALYRDVSSWYHVVIAVDTTDSTSSNRNCPSLICV